MRHSLFAILQIATIVETSRVFIRNRGKKLVQGTLLTTMSTSSSEDCLHECFVRSNCNTFNAIEEKPGRHICELFSNIYTCDLMVKSVEKSSVYFPSQECVNNRPSLFYLKDTGTGKYVYKANTKARMDQYTKADLFQMEDGNVLLGRTSECLSPMRNEEQLQLGSSNCLDFKILGDELILIGDKYCLNPKGSMIYIKKESCVSKNLKIEYKNT